jgi:uncharacterized protein YcaQ
MVHRLSRADARRIVIRAQLLDGTRPVGLNELVRELTLLQIDLTKAVAPNADLVAWSRLGARYSPTELTDALAGRALIELRGMIRPAEDVALYRAEMARWAGAEPMTGWRERNRTWVVANDACRRDVLAALAASGPLPAKELPDTCAVPWQSTGWNNDRTLALLLEQMELRGEIAVSARRGTERLWDLASRVYPDDPVVPLDEAVRTRNVLRLRSLGIARARGPECPVESQDVGAAGEPAVIDGVRGEWRVDPEGLDRAFDGRTAIISPLDRLIFDRKRMTEIFDFDYQLEMYKPKATRRWGYFALPILHGDTFVGKVDATADRKAGTLCVHAVHRDVPFTDRMTDEVDGELTDLAKWLELELVAER